MNEGYTLRYSGGSRPRRVPAVHQEHGRLHEPHLGEVPGEAPPRVRCGPSASSSRRRAAKPPTASPERRRPRRPDQRRPAHAPLHRLRQRGRPLQQARPRQVIERGEMNQTPEKGAEGRAGRGGRGERRRVASCEYHITRAECAAIDEDVSPRAIRGEHTHPNDRPTTLPPSRASRDLPITSPSVVGVPGGRSRSPPASPFSPAARGPAHGRGAPSLRQPLFLALLTVPLRARRPPRDRRPRRPTPRPRSRRRRRGGGGIAKAPAAP